MKLLNRFYLFDNSQNKTLELHLFHVSLDFVHVLSVIDLNDLKLLWVNLILGEYLLFCTPDYCYLCCTYLYSKNSIYFVSRFLHLNDVDHESFPPKAVIKGPQTKENKKNMTCTTMTWCFSSCSLTRIWFLFCS